MKRMSSLSRNRLNSFFALALIFSLLIGNSPAQASRGGVVVKDNKFTIGMDFMFGEEQNVCSGIPILPTLIMTAAHCIVNKDGVRGTDYVFTAPGVALDAAIDPSIVPPKIIKIVVAPNFRKNGINEGDDIAFIQLDKAIVKSGFINLATKDDLYKLTSSSVISGYGYGAVYETGATYSTYARKYKLDWKPIAAGSEIPGLIEFTNATTTACSGDSGGPITAVLPSGEEVVIGVMSGAGAVVNACGTLASDGLFHMRVTTALPYLDLVKDIYTPGQQMAFNKVIKKITCVKGALKKTVKGVNPKCPKGYKLKK